MRLTELEGAVLHLIMQNQPMTAYAVRAAFRRSLTTDWKASAGAIYPLVEKLCGKGLLAERSEVGDGRGTRKLSITRAGIRALVSWASVVDETPFGPVADPLRTRGYVLDRIAPATRVRLLRSWRDATHDMLAKVREAIRQTELEADVGERRALRGSELQLRARLAWLDELAAEFSVE